MATVMNYPPDPYRGWRNVNPFSNYPASRIMTDTSSSWQVVRDYGFYRVYEQRQGPWT